MTWLSCTMIDSGCTCNFATKEIVRQAVQLKGWGGGVGGGGGGGGG